MMRLLSKETLALLRSRYPKGARVELVRMDDPQAPPVGTKGTVLGVDDVGSILVVAGAEERQCFLTRKPHPLPPPSGGSL